ncbi:MAG: 3-dehydroquinate dehydratase [Frankiaceae bacterium]|nr:3-dehydroquinate dehydratase [Frankiaceae bacterium]MBV9869270.1 3-dehydroquinate dehydratase [Frankiaceae bacterium]
MSKQILVLNGPNIGQLGTREPDIYGSSTYGDLVAACEAAAAESGADIEVRQTDDEATYLGWLHDAQADGLILNPGAWTHTSVAVRDAAAQLRAPFIEVHLSNPLAREDFRHTSYTAGLAMGVVAGFGLDSYRLAISALVARI